MDYVTVKAILSGIWETWEKNQPDIPPDGNRVFVRHIDFDPNDSGWDDWSLVGLLSPSGVIDWIYEGNHELAVAQDIQLAIAAGEKFGRFQTELIRLEWGLFHGDGPIGERVSDWAAVWG
jgi:hypothetical protein